MRGKIILLRGWLNDPEASGLSDREASLLSDREASLLSDAVYMQRKRSERSLPLRPCVVGQRVWSAIPSQTAKRSRPPCACHMGEKVSSLGDVRNFSDPRHKVMRGLESPHNDRFLADQTLLLMTQGHEGQNQPASRLAQ
jgi:hypothetical protein